MNKKLLIIGAIVASLSLTGCSSDKSNEDIGNETPDQQDIMQVEDTDKDTTEDLKEDAEEPIISDDELIDTSDYIAKVKVIEKGKDNFELKVLENIKGNITENKIPNIFSFQMNRIYLIFLKDIDGKIEATNGKTSYIPLEGDNHEIFEKINKNR